MNPLLMNVSGLPAGPRPAGPASHAPEAGRLGDRRPPDECEATSFGRIVGSLVDQDRPAEDRMPEPPRSNRSWEDERHETSLAGPDTPKKRYPSGDEADHVGMTQATTPPPVGAERPLNSATSRVEQEGASPEASDSMPQQTEIAASSPGVDHARSAVQEPGQQVDGSALGGFSNGAQPVGALRDGMSDSTAWIGGSLSAELGARLATRPANQLAEDAIGYQEQHPWLASPSVVGSDGTALGDTVGDARDAGLARAGATKRDTASTMSAVDRSPETTSSGTAGPDAAPLTREGMKCAPEGVVHHQLADQFRQSDVGSDRENEDVPSERQTTLPRSRTIDSVVEPVVDAVVASTDELQPPASFDRRSTMTSEVGRPGRSELTSEAPVSPPSSADRSVPAAIVNAPQVGALERGSTMSRGAGISSPADGLAADPDAPRTLSDQLVRAIRLQWGNGIAEARLRLEPEHFGELTIVLRVVRGEVKAFLLAERADTRNMLRAQAHVLEHALATQGLVLESLSITADNARERREPPKGRPRRPSAARGDVEAIFDVRV